MSAAISPSYSKSTRFWSRMRTARCTRAERSPGRMAEGGEGEQRHARLIAEPTGDTRRFDCDLRQFLRFRHLGDCGVGDDDCAAAGQHERHAHHPVSGLGIDDAPHILQAPRKNCE